MNNTTNPSALIVCVGTVVDDSDVSVTLHRSFIRAFVECWHDVAADAVNYGITPRVFIDTERQWASFDTGDYRYELWPVAVPSLNVA